MSIDLLMELHDLIAKDTLDVDKIGRLRTDQDGISVNDGIIFTIYHPKPLL